MAAEFRRFENDSKNELEKKRLKNFPWPDPVGFAKVKGTEYLMTEPCFYFTKVIEDMEVREDDVWVIGYPKTGTSWLVELTWLIMNNIDYDRSNEDMYKRFPYLENESFLAHREDLKSNRDYYDKSLDYINKMESPRSIKTHYSWEFLPKQIRTGQVKPKIIYITRNHKDSCISAFNFLSKHSAYVGEFEDYCNLTLGNCYLLNFWRHVLDFWSRRNEPNILFLRYEELKADLPKVLNQVSKFLNKSYTSKQIEDLARYLDFDTMKKNKKMEFRENPLLKELNGQFMNKGKSGEYKHVMSEEMIEKFDDWAKKNIEGTDFPLEYLN